MVPAAAVALAAAADAPVAARAAPAAPVAPAAAPVVAPPLRQTLGRLWSAMGQKQVDMWRSHGSVRALSYYAFASLAVSAIALSVDRERDCSVPVFEWLAAHIAALLFRVASALAILFGSRRAQLFERRRPLLGALSRIADAGCVLLCIVGLCYVFATAGGDCPDESPYSYRALALLASFEGFVALLAIFVGTCALAGGWAGARGLRVPGMGFHAVAQQMEAAAASRGATLQQISMLPLRRFVKSKAASSDKLVELESADPIVELEAPPKKKTSSSDTDSSDAKKDEEADSDDSEMEHSCAVCLGEYEPGELVRVLPCEHYFHRECIDTWLVRNKTCPFCKHSVDAPPPVHAQMVHATTIAETASTDADE